MLYIQSWQYFQSIIHIVLKSDSEEEEAFPHTRASLVFELGKPTSGECLVCYVGASLLLTPPPIRDIQIYIYMGLFNDAHLLPRAATRVQISGSRDGSAASDTVELLWPSAGRQGRVFPSASLFCRGQSWTDGRLNQPQAIFWRNIFQHVKTLDRNALMDGVFLFVFSKENYIEMRFYL